MKRVSEGGAVTNKRQPNNNKIQNPNNNPLRGRSLKIEQNYPQIMKMLNKK